MKTARFEILVGMIIATSSIGARGFSCGPCGGPYTQVIPVLAPASGGDAGTDPGDYLAEACRTQCSGVDCVPTAITTDAGESIPAIACTRISDCGGAGRRPAGLAEPRAPAGEATAAWLGQMAFLEAAAVDAFRLLRRDLAAHGAPRTLLRGASRAARDERRHARSMRSLSRRRGGRFEAPRTAPTPRPSLEELARQNAVEGCVREAFGAVVARFQAEATPDRELAAALRRIAHEEAGHAALSLRIDAWARARLPRDARDRVAHAREAAARELLAAAAGPVPEALVRDLGHPASAATEALARRMIEVLGPREALA
jgi:hypothetical protein